MYQSEEYYGALLRKDPAYEGIFYACITSTSIFCLSTCRAKKPKFANTYFTDTIREAKREGFRPCKLCKPDWKEPSVPAAIRNLLGRLDRAERISDADLGALGLRPEYVRRWFKQRYGLTFHAYQRRYRVGRSIEAMRRGTSVQHAAYDQGYESVSGFSEVFKRQFAKAPSAVRDARIIYLSTFHSPLGELVICSTERGVCLLEFIDRKSLEREIEDIQRQFEAGIVFGEGYHVATVKKELAAYFAGVALTFHTPIDYRGTDFQEAVWKTLQIVAPGTTATYREVAVAIGSPSAVRAVANANGSNKISILVPCHRIIGNDGALRGYGGGLRRKEWLLRHEATWSQESS